MKKGNTETPSDELLTIISWKEEMLEDAKNAFEQFCYRFDDDLLRKCEVICAKWKYSKTVALEIRDCTFSRVWKYASSFDIEKINTKSIDVGIKFWLYKIANSQLANYHKKNTCHEPEKENLEIIFTINDMVEYTLGDADIESKRELKKELEVLSKILDGLNEKKRAIYLTYKTYEHLGIYNFKSAKKKLQEKFNLSQASVRKYNNEARAYVNQYLNNINGY